MKNISIFYLKIFILFGGKFSVYLYGRVFVMDDPDQFKYSRRLDMGAPAHKHI